MLTQILPIARNTFVESVRQPVVFVLVALSGFLQIINTWNTGFSMGYSTNDSSEVTGDNKLLFDIGLSTVFVVGAILAGFIATAVISKEIEKKTVLTVISKPVSRVALILGKYLGVSGAILCASITMIAFLLLGIRHGVMSTAGDDLDGPVLLFSGIALTLSIGLAAWCNYFYGWSFSQTALLLMLPLFVTAYIAVLFVSKKWAFQIPLVDFKPQVMTACACLLLAILVLSAVAVAASTRLGQVMTIVACLSVFVAALMSNFFLGRFVFQNQTVGMIQQSATQRDGDFLADQAPLTFRVDKPLPIDIKPGTPIYFSPSPNGFPMLTLSEYKPVTGNLDDINTLMGERATGPAIIVTVVDGQTLTIRNVGPTPVPMLRIPERGDYVFTNSTTIRPVPLVAWGIVPNLQFFWLLDAVTQNREVPASYLTLAAGYAATQITVFLCLAVILFQRRDVG
jgi:ABC-type transport system involved in multi-copper enzyme maturation permease subunit